MTNAVNDELMHSLDYKMRASNASYVISRKDVNYFPSSLSTITPTTSRVVRVPRVPLTSGSDFIDLESVKVAFRFVNNDGANDFRPIMGHPACLIKRIQLFFFCFANAARGVSCHARHCAHANLHAANQDGCTMYTQSLRCEHLLEGETNSRSPGASASRELSINRVKQARTTLHTKKRQTHIPLHASQRRGQCSIEHEA